MIRLITFLLAAFLPGLHVCRAQQFEAYFHPKSLRIDFILSGDSERQSASLFQMREEPFWGGTQVNLIDKLEYGGYYVKVYDKACGKLIYSKGFNTLFEEWRLTEQARKEIQGWVNSVSIPFPKNTVEVEILERSKSDMRFHTLLKWEIAPNSIFIDRGRLKDNTVTRIQYSGEPKEKVDLVFIGDGYTMEQQEKLTGDARRFTEALFEAAPFSGHRDDFNVWSVGIISEDAGTDISGEGIYKNTALNTGFYTFGVERYLTAPDMKSIRDAVWNVPCDAVFILVNEEKYGGGGMYNFYAIGTADNTQTIEVFMHEFGHSFAGLADEYFSSETGYDEAFYNPAHEPWEPNITTLVGFDAKWKSMLPENLPVPTPLSDAYKNEIGVFEGAGYMAKGIYRPADHCMMRDLGSFCPVCSRAIVRMINYFTGKPY